MTGKWGVVLAGLLVLPGCFHDIDEKPKAKAGDDDAKAPAARLITAPGRRHQGPDRVDRRPKVSDDAEQIAEVRAAYQKEQETLLKKTLEQLRDWGPRGSAGRAVLRRNKDHAVAELKRMLSSEKPAAGASAAPSANGPSAAGRVRLAQALRDLGDPAGERFLIDALKSDDMALRLAALRALEDREAGGVDLSSPERSGLVFACLDSPDAKVTEAAAAVAADRDLPGAEAKLVALLKSGRAKEPRAIARRLAEVAKGPEAVAVMLRDLLRERPKVYDQWTGFALQPLIDSPNPKIAAQVRDAYRKYLLGYTGSSRYERSVVRDLARVADQEMVPILEDIYATTKDALGRAYALAALARLKPETAVDRILEFLRPRAGERPMASLTVAADQKALDTVRDRAGGMAPTTVGTLAAADQADPVLTHSGRMAIRDLALYAKEQDAEKIVPVLLGPMSAAGGRPISLPIARLLIERLGARGRAAIEGRRDDLEPDARAWVKWKLEGLDLDTAIDDLRAAGIIKMDRAALRERMRLHHELIEAESPIDPSDPHTIFDALIQAGVMTRFDVETDRLPCEHDRLILDFGEQSGGAFQPECAVQDWKQTGPTDDRAPYWARFVLAGRLYEFGAENHGDWYDLDAVRLALDFAMKTSGRAERFIGLEAGRQIVAFVCARPEAFLPIAEKYGLVPLKAPRVNGPTANDKAGPDDKGTSSSPGEHTEGPAAPKPETPSTKSANHS